MPHGPDADAAILRAAHGLNLPPLAVRSPPAAASGPWEVTPDTVVLSALRAEGDAVFLRVYDGQVEFDLRPFEIQNVLFGLSPAV